MISARMFATHVLRFCGEPDGRVYAALACPCGACACPPCPRRTDLNRVVSERNEAFEVACEGQRDMAYVPWRMHLANVAVMALACPRAECARRSANAVYRRFAWAVDAALAPRWDARVPGTIARVLARSTVSDATRYAARLLRFCGERDEVVYAALACWCGGFPLCPRTWRFRRRAETRWRAAGGSSPEGTCDEATYLAEQRADVAAAALRAAGGEHLTMRSTLLLRSCLLGVLGRSFGWGMTGVEVAARVTGEFWRDPPRSI